MNAKRFLIGALACTLLLLSACAALVVWTDPLLTARTLGEGETALFVNERYEMAGLIRRQEYSNLLMGTSLVANFRASWFTTGTGNKTLKVTFPDGRLSEFDTALDLAYRTHGTLDTVFFCLDPNILIREDQTSALPEYLYNDNPIDDLQVYFNAESLALAVKSLMMPERARVALDDAYVWDWNHIFSRANALEGYPRPEPSGTALPAGAYLAAAQANMDIICAWAEEHPDTRFVVWFPPYSVLYWDKAQREGTADAILTAVEYAAGRLLAHDNIEVYSFLYATGLISDLNHYTDHIHCSSTITAYVAWSMMGGNWRLLPDIYPAQLAELRQFVDSYDYDAIFE